MQKTFLVSWSTLFFLIALIHFTFPAEELWSQPFGLTSRTPVSGINIPLADPGAPGSIRVVRGLPNITFSAPVLVLSPPDGSNRLFIVEKAGRIRVVANNDAATATTVFMDISTRVQAAGEQGLLGFAFAPDYSQSGYFYVYYSALNGAARSVISRFRVTSNPDVADPNSETVVIEVPQPSYSNHKAGMIAFGLDNMLYIALGDGGSGGDPSNTGQNCSDMLGAILRIDPAGASPYAIPSDNPYAGSTRYNCGVHTNALSRKCGTNGYATGEICKELYAVGLRNPFRFSFDQSNGNLWAGDVGQGAFEEIDLIRSGDNLGWAVFEGKSNYKNPSNLPMSQFRAPILDYPRSDGYSVTGGVVYRGSNLPSLYGKYIYGDYGSGNIWALDYNGSSVVSNQKFTTLGGVVAFGLDGNNELLALSINNGNLYRFLPPQTSGTPIPATLSQTGIFTNTANLQIQAGAIPYDVNAPLWSDGALKRRWLLLPGTQQIEFNATEAYNFPTGTAIVKHFELPINSTTNRRLETRVLFKHTEGWAGYTYKWRANNSDADLLTNSVSETYQVTPSGSAQSRDQTWYYPGRADCMNCHTSSAGRILSIRTQQLNKNYNYSGVTDNQLRAWNNINLFTTTLGAPTTYSAYAPYSDGSKSIESRARSYLASNCSSCHNPAEARTGVIDLRFSTANNSMGLINQRPIYGDLGIADAYRLRPGELGKSIILKRMVHTGEFRMPPLASSVVDSQGEALLTAWILNLGGLPVIGPAKPNNMRAP